MNPPGTIPGLLCSCAPVVCLNNGQRGVVVWLQDDPERGPGARVAALGGFDQSWAPLSAFSLDLDSPVGQDIALRWLGAGHRDCEWMRYRYMEIRTRLIGWSVMNVARGGAPIRTVIPRWSGSPDETVRWGHGDHGARIVVRPGHGWSLCLGTFERGEDISGPEEGAAGHAAADAAALRENIVLAEVGGAFTFPEMAP